MTTKPKAGIGHNQGPPLSPHDEQGGADSVARFAAKHHISRSQTYKELASGRLIGRKVGTRTIITHEDGAKWRRALPKLTVNDAPNTRGANNGLPAWLSDGKSEHLHHGRPPRRRTQPKTQETIEPEGENSKQKPPR